jgi:hypothetical protein
LKNMAANLRPAPDQTKMPPRRLLVIALASALAAGCVAMGKPAPFNTDEPYQAPASSFRG